MATLHQKECHDIILRSRGLPSHILWVHCICLECTTIDSPARVTVREQRYY